MPTWMVVEDEPDIYDVLLAMFEIWGIEGVAFVDGGEAVSWIEDVDAGRVRGELPELAIIDIRLPEVAGPAVGARLRKSPVLGDIAIVLITAYRLTSENEAAHIAEADADLLMYKPLPVMAELRRTMDSVIAKRRRIKAARTGTESAPVNVEEAKPAATSTTNASPASGPLAGGAGGGATASGTGPLAGKTRAPGAVEPAPPSEPTPQSSNGKSSSGH